MATSFKSSHAGTAARSAPNTVAGHCRPTPLLETPGHPHPGGAISKIPCDHVTGRLYSSGPKTLLQGLPVSPWGLTDAETTPGGRSELSAAHKQGDRPQTGWNQLDEADSQLPHHQAIRRMPTNWSHLPLWTHDDKTPLCPFQVRTQFWGRSLLWSSLPGKVIKLFFSTS